MTIARGLLKRVYRLAKKYTPSVLGCVERMYFRYVPIQKNKIVFDSLCGKGYGDNPKYIAEEILRRGLNWDLVWAVRDLSVELPDGIRKVEYETSKHMRELATSKVWVNNVRAWKRPTKKEGQIYLQTWHGGIGPKKVEKDAKEKLSSKYVSAAIVDGGQTDGIIADSLFQVEVFRRSFWLSDQTEILKIGLPRVDYIILNQKNEVLKANIRKKVGISNTAFAVMYAPTFRDDRSTVGYLTDFSALYAVMRKRYPEVVILLRLHPNVAEQFDSVAFEQYVVNVSSYPDVQELLLISDCIISDYSSIPYDFLIQKKPGLILAKDLKDYQEIRGLEDLFFDSPFPISRSEEELFQNILNFDLTDYQNKVDCFFKKYQLYDDGHSSERAVDWILQKMKDS